MVAQAKKMPIQAWITTFDGMVVDERQVTNIFL